MSDQDQAGDLLDHGHRIAQLELKVAELYRRLGQEEPAGGFVFASDARASDNVIEHPRMAEALQRGNKIEAIKLYRELTGAGLKEAKDAVERIAP
ncbi:MAG: ribosomal protein L7/L12 [Solirubrobacterales bacterium]